MSYLLAEVSFPIPWQVPLERREAVKRILPRLQLDDEGNILNRWTTFVVDLQLLRTVVPSTVDVYVKLLPAPEFPRAPEHPELYLNERVQVVVPDIGLLAIRYVRVIENACTDDLQTHLDVGWRILAVCPQSARRPDYILGASTALP